MEPEAQNTAVAEHDAYAEHRDALDATLFRPASPDLVLVLEDGRLAPTS